MSSPVALAYVSLPARAGVGSWEEETAGVSRALAAFASREGYALGGVFTDVRGRTESGLNALLEAVRRGDAVAVVVPDLDHLRHVGCLAGADLRTAARYLRARLLAVAPDQHHVPCHGAPAVQPTGSPNPRTGRGTFPVAAVTRTPAAVRR